MAKNIKFNSLEKDLTGNSDLKIASQKAVKSYVDTEAGKKLDTPTNKITIPTAVTITNSTVSGTTGTIHWDSSHIYVCVATNTWKRADLGTW
jgi:hypothetical protein